MAIDNRHDIKVLNGLYVSLLDNAAGYRQAIEASPDGGHRAYYEARETERRTLAGEIEQSIVALGGEADQGGSLLAKAQKAIKDVSHALRRDEAAAVGDVDNGETALLARFDAALADGDLAATTRETIRRARDRVTRGHDEMAALRHSLEGQRDASSDLYPN